jgi:hypothetical protein
MRPTVLCARCGDYPCRARRIVEVFEFGSAKAGDFPNTGTREQRKTKTEACTARSRRLKNPVPKEPDFTIR